MRIAGFLLSLILVIGVAGATLGSTPNPKKSPDQTYCYKGECVPYAYNENAPQNFIDYPVSRDKFVQAALAGGSVKKLPTGGEGWSLPCDSKTHQTDWYRLAPDGDLTMDIGSGTCDIQTTAWNRDHWTVTCWVDSSSRNDTHYQCHNWNTIWGDAWHASFMGMACPTSGCVVPKKQ